MQELIHRYQRARESAKEAFRIVDPILGVHRGLVWILQQRALEQPPGRGFLQ